VKELPDYVGKTRQISEAAQRILHAVKDARQPDRLLFVELPAACGFAPFEATGAVDGGQVEGTSPPCDQASANYSGPTRSCSRRSNG